MGTAGHANAALDRAIEAGRMGQVELAATACDQIPLEQAVGICLVYLSADPRRWQRAASRLLERIISESSCDIDQAAVLATALAGGTATAPALAATLAELGLEPAADRVDVWLARPNRSAP